MSGWASRMAATCFTPIFSASAANMTADQELPGGTCGREAGCVLAPHTTCPLVDDKHLTSANSSLNVNVLLLKTLKSKQNPVKDKSSKEKATSTFIQKNQEVSHFVNTHLCTDPVLRVDAWLQNKAKFVKITVPTKSRYPLLTILTTYHNGFT